MDRREWKSPNTDQEGRRDTAAGKMEQLGREILDSAKRELYLSMQFLDLAFGTLEPQMDRRTFLMGTEGQKLYFNPARLGERYLENPVLVQRAYLHSILHCILGHMFSENIEAGEDWELACDIAVEYVIDHLDYACVRQVIPPERQELYERLEKGYPVVTAEAVLDYLGERPEILEKRMLFLADDHGYWEKKGQEGREEDGKRKQEKEKGSWDGGKDRRQQGGQKVNWARISEKLQLSLETFHRSQHKEAAALYQELAVHNTPRADYESFLRRFTVVREELQMDEDSFDPVFYHFGMERYGNMPLIEPLEYKETVKIHEFVIVLDTSGSCSGRQIHQFMEKTIGLLHTSSFAQRTAIHILQCDDQVNEDIYLEDPGQMEEYLSHMVIKGHGNTDFRPAFAYVEELRERGEMKNLQGLLYFTDGYGRYPGKRPDYDVAFIFPQEDPDRPPVPAWAIETVLN